MSSDQDRRIEVLEMEVKFLQRRLAQLEAKIAGMAVNVVPNFGYPNANNPRRPRAVEPLPPIYTDEPKQELMTEKPPTREPGIMS